MTIYTDALKIGENVYNIASERSERADSFKYLRWKHTIILKLVALKEKNCIQYVPENIIYVTDCERGSRNFRSLRWKRAILLSVLLSK